MGPKGVKKAATTAPPDTRDAFQGAYSNHETSTFKVEIKKGLQAGVKIAVAATNTQNLSDGAPAKIVEQ